jgi:hypothetical protein
LPPDSTLVLRGDELEPEVVAESAAENHGIYGISVFVESPGFAWPEIAASRLAWAEWLALFTAGVNEPR